MAFKVKGTTERDIFEAENEQRLDILNQLLVLDIKTLQIAYVYAKNYAEYGVDVTKKWVTACQNSANLERAHHKGYCEGYEKAKQDYCDNSTDSDLKACTDEEKEPKFKVGDKILISDAWSFDDDKVECVVTEVLDNDRYKVTSYGSELEVYEHEMELVKEEKSKNPIYKFEIGQIVGKVNGYPDPSAFKILDRFVVNLIHPYYKIGLIDRFFGNGSQETVPNHYEYVPENRLKLPDEDNTHISTFKFHVGDIVRFRYMDHGLFKITVRYADPNLNAYKIDNMIDGWSIVAYEHQLELATKR